MLVAVAVAGLVAGIAGLSIAVVAHNRVNQVVDECGEMLRRQLQVASGEVDERALRDLAIVHYDALKEMSGHRSFSLALINAVGDGVVVSSINGRTETRTYAKAVQGGHAVETLSPRRTRPCGPPGSARAPSSRWTTRCPTSATAPAPPRPAPEAMPERAPDRRLRRWRPGR